jgi:hypothetical protein
MPARPISSRRPARRSRAPLVVLSTLVIGAISIGGVWLARKRVTAITEVTKPSSPPLHGRPPSSPGAAAKPTAMPGGPDAAGRLAVLAPELSPSAARRLVAATATYSSEVFLAERGLLLATNGFSSMRREDVAELGRLYSRGYQGLGPADREWMSTYVQRLRGGALTAEDSTRGRTLMTRSVNALSATERSKLQSLFERALVAGLRDEQLAAERARNESATAPPPRSASSSSTGSPPVSFGGTPWEDRTARNDAARSGNAAPPQRETNAKGEAYWRSRMQAARERVTSLEKRVADLERTSNASAYGSGYVEVCRPPERLTRETERAYQECVQRTGAQPFREVAGHQRDLERLDQARRDLAAARIAVSDLEDEARRAGAPPGWLR